jgi:hypothetical protein
MLTALEAINADARDETGLPKSVPDE